MKFGKKDMKIFKKCISDQRQLKNYDSDFNKTFLKFLGVWIYRKTLKERKRSCLLLQTHSKTREIILLLVRYFLLLCIIDIMLLVVLCATIPYD